MMEWGSNLEDEGKGELSFLLPICIISFFYFYFFYSLSTRDKACRHRTCSGKQTPLPGRYHSNCTPGVYSSSCLLFRSQLKYQKSLNHCTLSPPTLKLCSLQNPYYFSCKEYHDLVIFIYNFTFMCFYYFLFCYFFIMYKFKII